MSDRAIGLTAIAVVIGGFLALALISSGTKGIVVAGAATALFWAVIGAVSRAKPFMVPLSAIVALAILIATAGTTIGAALCTADSFSNVGQCREDGLPRAGSVDNDYHGWPIPWRTDDVGYGFYDSNSGPDITSKDGTVLPFAIASLLVWFLIALIIEGIVIAAWRTVRRVRVHGTLFPAGNGA